jgi:hypothetical protein
LFTHPQFLLFIEKLLFDRNLEVTFVEVPNLDEEKQTQLMIRNRGKLYDLMKRKGLVSSITNKPTKYR